MASPSRDPKSGLAGQVENEPYRFSFVQTIRLLQKVREELTLPITELGSDTHPADEFLRLIAHPSRTFPGAQIMHVTERPSRSEVNGDRHLAVVTAFMGLYGPSGVLPYFDTQRIIDSIPRSGGKTLIKGVPEKDLLDLFTHRILSLFYRASTKYRLPIAYDRTYSSHPSTVDLFTTSLFAIAGMGTAGLRNRQEVKDEITIEFSGYFSGFPKNSVSLARMLSAYYMVPATIQQFVGQWRNLSASDRSEMPTRAKPLGLNCQLGASFIVGERIWDIQGKFRVCLGPLTYDQFVTFLPGSRVLTAIAQTVRLYAGPQFEFDLQLELIGTEVPRCGLVGGTRLGQNSWLIGDRAGENRKDAVICVTGAPNDITA